MRVATMRAGVLAFVGASPSAKVAPIRVEARTAPAREGWNPQEFARAQIRCLVHQLFQTAQPRPLRQVVFSAADLQTDALEVCRSVGEVLALETTMDVAVAGDGLESTRVEELLVRSSEAGSPLREAGAQLRRNLWHLPLEVSGAEGSAASLHRYISAVRREFEYSIIAAPAAISSQMMALAQLADGIVLVLSAQHTRRGQARKIKATLEEAQLRLLGMVLSDREFPIPERIYRRL